MVCGAMATRSKIKPQIKNKKSVFPSASLASDGMLEMYEHLMYMCKNARIEERQRFCEALLAH
jgi:hypothetical protein